MKKAVIILSAILLIASGCRQAMKKQTETATENSVENINIRQYGGIYILGDKNSDTPHGTVYIYPETDTIALFYLFKSRGAPSYNVGSIDGRITIQDGKATFRKHYDLLENDCVLRFEFSNDTLTVTENENDCDCPFGYGVYINNTFLRITSDIPQYYTNLSNEKIYFSEWKENEEEITESSSAKEIDWESAICKEYQEDGGYTTIQECIFPNANLQQVYNIVKKIDPNLKTDLPAKNIEYPSTKNGCISVEYQYKSEKYLYIELFYNGGATYLEIIENKNETQSKITYSAD